MLKMTKNSLLGQEYILTGDGRETAKVSLKRGQFSLDGAGYRVRTHRFSGVYELLTAAGTVLATTDRVSRRWSLHAAGRDYEFRQTEPAGRAYSMVGGSGGSISRTGPGHAGGSVDLPGLEPELQVFVLVAVLLRRRRKRAAAAVRGSVLAGG